MTKPRLRAAVVGCGAVGQLHAQAIRHSQHADLVAVCDKDRDAAERAAGQYGGVCYESVEQLLLAEQLDFITVATPDALHVSPTLAAIERGIHVFCEKPLGSTYAEADRIARTARGANVCVGVDYNRRFGFGYAKAMSICQEATRLGLQQIVLHVLDGIPEKVALQPYAMLTSLLTHHLDLLRWFGGDVLSIHARLVGPRLDGPHHAAIILEHHGGAMGCLSADWRAGQRRTTEQMRIVTDTCVIHVDDVQRQVEVWGIDPDDVQIFRPSPFGGGNRFYDTVIAHVMAFAERLHGRGSRRDRASDRASIHENCATAEDACATMRIIEAAIKSDRLGRRIVIGEGDERE